MKILSCAFRSARLHTAAAALLSVTTLGLVAGDAPASATAKGAYEHFARTRIAIKAPADAVGKLVSITDAAGSELGVGRFTAGKNDAVATVVLPMPSVGKPYPELRCKLPDGASIVVSLPDAEQARHRAFDEAPVVFHSAVFSGDKFPSCDFKEPTLIEAAAGGYTLSTAFYDEGFAEVASAAKPGRYGAVITVAAPNGWTSKRFVTLYRLAGQIHWRDADTHLGGVELPAGAGVEAPVAVEQAETVAGYLNTRLFGNGDDSSSAAQLLACLRLTTPGAGKLTLRSGPTESDARWWFTLRKRLGLLQHRYLTFLPTGYETDAQAHFPLLLFLHGSGERGSNVEEVRVHGPHKYLTAHGNPFIIIEPQCDAGQWWHACEVIDLLDEVRAKYRVDDQRVYLTGLSMGGFGTWATLGEFPQRFAAAVPICGGGDPAEAPAMKNVPIWAFHGAKDPTVPLKSSQEMIDAVTKQGDPAKLTVFPEAQHDSWTEAYNTPELYTWLLQQRLGQPAQPPAR